MSTTPIAYIDPTGFVMAPIVGRGYTAAAMAKLVPVYTVEERDAALARFKEKQMEGAMEPMTVESAQAQVAAAAEGRKADSAANSPNNQTAGAAALQALGLTPRVAV